MAPGGYDFASKGHTLNATERYLGGKAYLSVLLSVYKPKHILILSVLEKGILIKELEEFSLPSDFFLNKRETDPSALVETVKTYL